MLLHGLSMVVVFLIFIMSSPQPQEECVLLLSFLDLSLSLFLLGVFLGDFIMAHPRQPQPQPRHRRRRRESQREEEEVLVRWSPCRQYSRMMT